MCVYYTHNLHTGRGLPDPPVAGLHILALLLADYSPSLGSKRSNLNSPTIGRQRKRDSSRKFQVWAKLYNENPERDSVGRLVYYTMCRKIFDFSLISPFDFTREFELRDLQCKNGHGISTHQSSL